MAIELPPFILRAIKCGPIPTVRNWRRVKVENLTRAERIMKFMETFLLVPEGKLVGRPLKLALFQEVFIYAVYDNPHGTNDAYLSIGRKNAKTATIAGLVTAHTIGPEAVLNSQIISGAMSREQAGVVFKLANKMLRQNPQLSHLYHAVPSIKQITGLGKGVEYQAISAEATTAHGLSPVLAILDEVGQIVGPKSDFVEAITTAQGAHDDPLLIAISTSAAGDADMFSVWCDDAEVSQDPHTVCHVYTADKDCDLMDREQWQNSNPALGIFRSERDLKKQLVKAQRLPSLESSKRNLLLNQRTSLVNKWLAPAVWKENNSAPRWELFKENGVHVGLDLSQKNDLTAAVISAKDDSGVVDVHCYAFTPIDGIHDRSRADRVPYDDFVRDGYIVGVPGRTVDYDYVAAFLKAELLDKGIAINSIEFDPWRIKDFQKACNDSGMPYNIDWVPVPQTFKGMSPRIEAMETALLQNKIRHGNHPILNLGASSAIVVFDSQKNKKLDKAKASNKIDAIVAMVMSIYPLIGSGELPFDVDALVG